MNHTFLKAIVSILFFMACISLPCFAKEVNLYESPDNGAKVTRKLDLATGIIPIYSPKNSTWLKVADPNNGDVGWIKIADLKEPQGSAISVTQRFVNDGNTPLAYQVVKYGEVNKISDADMQAVITKIRVQQQAVQETLSKTFQQMMNSFDEISKQMPTIMIVQPPANTPVNKPVTNNSAPKKTGN